MEKKLIVIAGPTATGKTRLGVELARQYGGEVVSADSMQVYRGMDIGTAKAGIAERGGVVHHMLDVAEPWEGYSAARYGAEAAACCQDIMARGKLPVVVGGTGLYIDSLLSGRDYAAAPEDGALRRELSAQYDAVGGARMLETLREIDPERAALLHAGDKRRIVRALEVYRLTGETISDHDRRTKELPPRFKSARMILSFRDRSRLYERIDRRVDEMAAAGLFRETAALLASGLSEGCTAMQAIGYKEAAMALRGEISREEAIALIKRGSRRYAKRQLTWFSRDREALWILWEDSPDFEYARRVSTEFLTRSGIS